MAARNAAAESCVAGGKSGTDDGMAPHFLGPLAVALNPSVASASAGTGVGRGVRRDNRSESNHLMCGCRAGRPFDGPTVAHGCSFYRQASRRAMRSRMDRCEVVAGSRRIRRRLIGAALTLALAWPAARRAQEAAEAVLRLRGFGLNLTGIGHGRSEDFEIAVERWSTDAERDHLRQALADGGIAALVARDRGPHGARRQRPHPARGHAGPQVRARGGHPGRRAARAAGDRAAERARHQPARRHP